MDCQEGADVEQEKNREDGLEVHREEECCAQQTGLHRIGIVEALLVLSVVMGVRIDYIHSRKSESTLHLASQP